MTNTGEAASSPTPSGWYPDPAGGDGLRYFDGARWTDNWAAPSGPGASSAASVGPAAPSSPAAGTAAPGPAWSQAPAVGATGSVPVGGFASGGAPPFAAPPGPGHPGYTGAPAYAGPPGYPSGPAAPVPQQGMSGCLKAFLIVLAISVVAGIALFVSLIVIGTRVVHHLSTTISGTPGRPGSLPAGASDYAGERRQDHVAGSNGAVSIGSLGATSANWARTTDNGNQLICGDVTIHRATVTSKDPFDAALQLAGDFSWELETPSGSSVSLDSTSSAVSSLSDYLATGQTGDATGKVCFPDPGGSGQFAVAWQPRLFRAERAVWIFKLN